MATCTDANGGVEYAAVLHCTPCTLTTVAGRTEGPPCRSTIRPLTYQDRYVENGPRTMLMNPIEFWAMNNPVRGLIQKHYEAPRLRRLAKGSANAVLEIGCGQGVGAGIIDTMFAPEKYVGIDLDPKMLKRAKTKARGLRNATFLQGDASRLPFGDNTFDLVIDFGVVHHIPNWTEALAEVHRTLTTGGEFLFEELPLETWERGIGRPLKKHLEHPYEHMFRRDEFVAALEKLGFETETYEKNPISFYYFWGKAAKMT